MGNVELQRLNALEEENRRLERVVAEQTPNIQAAKEAFEREW